MAAKSEFGIERPVQRSIERASVLAFLLILLAAFATRFVAFGNPVANPDDQFYLLVGDAMRHGTMPYTGIWDRKPFGLFALFWLIAVVGNSSILMMQVIATLFATATAMVVRRIALFFTNATGALLAALAYIFMLPLFSGQTAQAPLFFNLFVALAALSLIGAVGQPLSAIRIRALWAMLAAGIAIALKPVAVVEGIFFGLAFLWLMYKARERWGRLAATAAAMIFIALLPTILPMLGYLMAGKEAFDIFFQANFLSIFEKTSFGASSRLAGLAYFFLYMGPLVVLSVLGLTFARRDTDDAQQWFLLAGWVIAGVGGFLSVPYFFDQYAMPLIGPLAVAAAPAFGRPSGKLYAAGLAVFCVLAGQMTDWRSNREATEAYYKASAVIAQERKGGCILVNDGPTWLYKSSGGCGLTRYLFPGHLNLVTDVDSVGVDTRAETARILALRPAIIVTQDRAIKRHNPVTERLIDEALARDYQLIARTRDGIPGNVETLRIWQRRDLGPPPAEVPVF